MKSKILAAVFAVFATVASAQNLQVHYDFGKLINSPESSRQNMTLTLEQFKADELGSWFYFVDLDLMGKNTAVSGAYTEISREFNLGKQSPFAAHVEFDGGLNQFGSFQSAVLVGPAYNGHTADFSKTWSVQLMYKQFLKGASNKALASFQLTGVWGINFADNKLRFSGFADLWYGPRPYKKNGLAFITEPQLWYNISNKFAVGTEVEISNDFIFHDLSTDNSFYVNPTLAVKYNF